VRHSAEFTGLPPVLFTFLDGRIPVQNAALIGAVAAVIVVAVTARRGVPVLPIVQTITLAVIQPAAPQPPMGY
jgi:hypothetical protein